MFLSDGKQVLLRLLYYVDICLRCKAPVPVGKAAKMSLFKYMIRVKISVLCFAKVKVIQNAEVIYNKALKVKKHKLLKKKF